MKYLASPYTDPDPFIREERYLRASRVLAWLLKTSTWVYSPIVHCHELAKIADLPKDFAFWKQYNFHMLSKADEVLVLRIEGWETSVGIKAEIQEAERLGIPVRYI